jgi:hypothetical protein
MYVRRRSWKAMQVLRPPTKHQLRAAFAAQYPRDRICDCCRLELRLEGRAVGMACARLIKSGQFQDLRRVTR